MTKIKFTDIKDRIINNKKVKDLEHQIDQFIYKLYNLTPEEIKIVENSIKKSPIF